MPVRPTLSVDDGLDDDVTSTPASSTSTSVRAAQSTGLSAGDGPAQPGGAGVVSVSVGGLVMAGILGVAGFMFPLL